MRYASSSGKDVRELFGREGSVTLVVSISSMTAMAELDDEQLGICAGPG